MNRDPHAARAARKQKAVGTIDDLREQVWHAIEAAAAVLHDPEADPTLRLRGVHAVTQAAGAYTKVLEACEFEARLRDLELKIEQDNR